MDKWSRFWLPLLYSIALGFLLNLDTNYDSTTGSVMFQGVGPMHMSLPGVLQALILPTIGLVSLFTWLQMRRKQQKKAAFATDEAPGLSARPRPRWTMRVSAAAQPNDEPGDASSVESEKHCDL